MQFHHNFNFEPSQSNENSLSKVQHGLPKQCSSSHAHQVIAFENDILFTPCSVMPRLTQREISGNIRADKEHYMAKCL